MTLTLTRKVLLDDALLLSAACFIPAMCHLTALPLNQLDPMRWLLLGSLLLGCRNRCMTANGLLMAVALPLVSCFLVGMPSLAKALLMVVELGANVALFSVLLNAFGGSRKAIFGAMALAVVGAKAVYYGLKSLMLASGILAGTLFGTSIALQSGLVLAFAMMMALVMKRR